MEAFKGLVHSVFGLTLVRFLPTLSTSVGTVTLIFITTWFYSDHCWEFKEPIDHQQISDYMCCEPGRTVGLIGLIAGSLLLICASVPIRDRFASLSATNRRCGLFMQVVLIFAAIGLMGVGIVDICWNHFLHDCFAETFFLFGLALMWTYNAFFIWNAPPPAADAPLLVGHVLQSRWLRLVLCIMPSITNFYYGEPLEWLASEWTTVSCYFFVIGAIMQADILYPPQTTSTAAGDEEPAKGGSADAEEAPLLSQQDNDNDNDNE